MQVNGACSCRKVTICSGMLITFTGKSGGGGATSRRLKLFAKHETFSDQFKLRCSFRLS